MILEVKSKIIGPGSLTPQKMISRIIAFPFNSIDGGTIIVSDHRPVFRQKVFGIITSMDLLMGFRCNATDII